MRLKLTFTSIPRAADASNRAVTLALAGRFADELLGGMPDVLLPTIRDRLGLAYAQVALLPLALQAVGAVVEPAGGLLIDAWNRRWLLAWGAAGIGLALVVTGAAPAFPVLIAGFAIYGLAAGPLAHTADAVLVEAHPAAPGRIFARATAIDTVGALLAPLLVSAAVWGGIDWRALLVAGGAGGLCYAAMLASTRFPPPARAGREGAGLIRELRANVRAVLGSPAALGWLAFLVALDVVEAPFALKTVWLADVAGMGQALIGVYRAVEMTAMLAGLLVLDRWLQRASPHRVLMTAGGGFALLLPAWFLAPGIAARFVLGVPLNFLFSVLWPIGRSQALVSVPGRPGTVSALSSLTALAPLPLVVGVLAERVGLTPAMLAVHALGLALLLATTWRLRR